MERGKPGERKRSFPGVRHDLPNAAVRQEHWEEAMALEPHFAKCAAAGQLLLSSQPCQFAPSNAAYAL